MDDIETFRDLFGPPVVRSLLDWEALLRLRPAVTTQVMVSAESIGGLRTTWYLDETGAGEVDYATSSCPPITVAEAAARLHDLDPARQRHLDATARHLGTQAILAPLYRLNHHDLLILDGNHRLVAAYLRGTEVRVLAMILHGPLDPQVLPDLAFWAPGH
ncbi:hypothetical protein [Ornithinimicrobium humiphilum]|uniref:hypothetical protein n=1 Tax=Ornithinimicrobium humiphilum TaxID=125288 RepID=UPI00115234C0|nr:hypothetical protein [Ornithinimicrobium humiphilum]